jgi:hypothetical protein
MNIPEALRLYRMSAEQGYITAQYVVIAPLLDAGFGSRYDGGACVLCLIALTHRHTSRVVASLNLLLISNLPCDITLLTNTGTPLD